jgi:hypothetical protein
MTRGTVIMLRPFAASLKRNINGDLPTLIRNSNQPRVIPRCKFYRPIFFVR